MRDFIIEAGKKGNTAALLTGITGIITSKLNLVLDLFYIKFFAVNDLGKLRH